MIKPDHSNNHPLMQELAAKLIRSQRWALLPSPAQRCALRHRASNRIFLLVHGDVIGGDLQGAADCRLLDQGCLAGISAKPSIFLQIFRISQEYYLSEKYAMCLKDKRRPCTLDCSEQDFTEEEILNTFTPILEAVARNLVPPFYRITPLNIFIDHQYNVRLGSPLATLDHTQGMKDAGHLQQIGLSLMEFALNLPAHKISTLAEKKPRLIEHLVRKNYSFKIISLILILLSDQDETKATLVRQWSASEFCSPWFHLLKETIIELACSLSDPCTDNKNENSYLKFNRSPSRPEVRQEEETEDSQNFGLAKYRNGKRIHSKIGHYSKDTDDEELLKTQLKPRKDRLKPHFNI